MAKERSNFYVDMDRLVTVGQAMQVLSQLSYLGLCEVASLVDGDADKMADAALAYFEGDAATGEPTDAQG